MSIFDPGYIFHRAYEIAPQWLAAKGISVLLLDVDNTLTLHDAPGISGEMQKWLDELRAQGIALFIISNNSRERVQPFADGLGLGCIANAAKPSTVGVDRAIERLGVKKEQIALIGDQIFTDIWCANRAGVLSILVEPMEPEPWLRFKLKRILEKPILRRWKKRRAKQGEAR